jgi:hypothetical protein
MGAKLSLVLQASIRPKDEDEGEGCNEVLTFRGEIRFSALEVPLPPGVVHPGDSLPPYITFSALFDEGRVLNIKELVKTNI